MSKIDIETGNKIFMLGITFCILMGLQIPIMFFVGMLLGLASSSWTVISFIINKEVEKEGAKEQ